MHILQLPTPCFVINAETLDANIERMTLRAAELGITLRPHGKTPKCAEIGRRLVRHGGGLCTSTLREAEQYFAAGISDLFYAVALTPSKAPRAADLIMKGAGLRCLIDDPDGVEGIARVAQRAGITIPLFIEIAADDYRSGVAPSGPQLIELAALIDQAPGLKLSGVMSYGGASYQCDPDQAAALAEHHRTALVDGAQRLRDEGHNVDTVSFGSTPAVLHARKMQGVTELRCGIYMFQDLFQAAIGACALEDIAGSVLTEVISRQPHHNRFVIDAGGLALSKDRSTAATGQDAGFGLVCDAVTGQVIDDLFVQATSQELGLVTTLSGGPVSLSDFPVGRRLRILPNHADMTAAAYGAYHMVDGTGRVLDRLERFNGW